MNYTENIAQIIETNHDILIDTSTLMNSDRMELFIEEIEDLLILKGRKLIILEPVLLELTKHSISNNPRKKQEADNALELIRRRQDLFEIREGESNEENPFADSALLSELIKNKRHYKQLLISNDEKMTKDAFYFNRFNSVMGGWITICFISPEGKMKRCHVNEAQPEGRKQSIPKPEIKYRTIEKVKYVKEQPCAIEKYGRFALGFAGGVAITIGWKSMTKILKAVIY